jgi:HEAT repeat protein
MKRATVLAGSFIICGLLLGGAHDGAGDKPDEAESRMEFLRLAQEVADMGVAGDDVVAALRGSDDKAAQRALLLLVESEPAATSSPFWGPAVNQVRTDAARLLIEHGVSVVVPVLRRWASELASSAHRVDPQKLNVIEMGLVTFQAKEALPELRAMLYSQIPEVRQTALRTVAVLEAPEAASIQQQIVNDGSLNLRLRCEAATALTRLGNEPGRVFLIEGYTQYLQELESSGNHSDTLGCTDGLETLHDRQIILTLEGLVTKAPDGVTKRNIQYFINRMKLNGKSTDELKKLAADNDWARAHETRYAAIEELSRRGGPEMIGFFEQLKPWVNPTGAAEPVCHLVEGQKQIMRDDIVGPAIARIRLRAWRRVAGTPK